MAFLMARVEGDKRRACLSRRERVRGPRTEKGPVVSKIAELGSRSGHKMGAGHRSDRAHQQWTFFDPTPESASAESLRSGLGEATSATNLNRWNSRSSASCVDSSPRAQSVEDETSRDQNQVETRFDGVGEWSVPLLDASETLS